MRFGVIVFPGTWSDVDCFHVFEKVYRQPVEYVWHKEKDLSKFDCVILPGGFSYGDYLRCGAIARFSPVMDSVKSFADKGKLVYGICNGFQILCEAGLLPGALRRNADLQFHCEWVNLRTETNDTPFTGAAKKGQILRIPISHGEGNYYASPSELKRLRDRNGVVFSYSTADGKLTADANPNGSIENIAGIRDERGNVMGMMPHPERCSESIIGGTDGKVIFNSIIKSIASGSSQKRKAAS